MDRGDFRSQDIAENLILNCVECSHIEKVQVPPMENSQPRRVSSCQDSTFSQQSLTLVNNRIPLENIVL